MIATRRRLAAARRTERGMTLIEILVVLAIIGLIVGGVAVAAFGRLDSARINTAKNQVIQIQQQCEMYMLEKSGKCPADLQDLKAAGVISKVSKDPWGQDYQITCPGEHGSVDVVSWGPDAKSGGDDDITSWDAEGADADKKK
ncbi:MAG: type II secretion system protein GspG [Myxococcales bacterium]|nr:type II secretion system protein GspG [Myxococcales bacterium]MCB9704252.1 type II secretion system protein GspG [Myxococcales bacterium]